MDPSIVKKLLEDDEDETMHSGADLLAFQAALNKDIEGDVSASQPSDSDTAVLSQGSNNTSSQSLLQLSTASQDVNTAGQIQQDQKIAQHRELHLYEMEPKQQGSIAENMQQKNDASKVLNHFPLPQKHPHGDLQEGQAEQRPLQIPETTGMLISEKHPSSTEEHGIGPNLKSESQYLKLQKMSSQQSMITEQPRNPSNQSRQVVFYQLYPLLLPQLNKDRGRQLTTLFGRLKSRQIRKDAFVRELKSIVGDEMLRMAVKEAPLMPSPNHRLLPKALVLQQPPRMLSISAGAAQLTNPRSSALHLRGPNSATDPSHSLPSTVQVQTDSSHPLIKNSARKLPEAECHSDSEGMQVSQISSSSVVATNQERECFSVPMHGNAGGTCHPFSGTSVNTCALPVKPQPSDAQLRQVLQHQSIGSAQSGGEARGANIMSVSKTERQNSMNEPSRLQGGSLTHFTTNATLQQNPNPSQSSNKEQSSRPVSSMAYVKQELIDQTAEQQHKPPLPSSHGLPLVSAGVLEQGNASSVISMDESLEKQPSRMGVSSSPSSSTITVPQSSVSPSVMMQVNPSVSLGPRISSGTSPCGINNKTPPNKPSIGRKKLLEAGSSPPQSSKKQKVSGAFSDIEQLNDVTAVSGVNLREEEEQLFPGPKEDSRASEASRKSVQKEEERLILEKAPLQKKLAEIMVKCGLKSVTHDVERCLSLCVEERMRGLINNLIRLSKQRVDAEKSRHHTITNSDVRQQIMDLNQKAREEWEKKQAGAEKIRRLNEPEVDNGVDGDEEKDESHPKSFKTNIEADGKLRTTAANVAARAAVGGDDMFSKWQLMAQARQKHEGEIDAASGSQPGKDVNHKPTSTTRRIMKGSQEAEKRGGPAPVATAGPIRKSGRNQVIMPQTRMARTISVKDMIAALEREPQMSKSMLIYRLHERIQS
ncbi:PREDICTED: mRNAion initiation factor [Prunus dulcis]|uniref:PREDICTED: mRNAion initiation factor n=1 Tax=Prunus dulcis TaxID=3755 RepID=A0A5E4G295_PRUDU|nr:transcription initiation factor TFIID subunit 4b-like isoform X2 [Prunus dulcis]XP_034219691.1 transcription initiation factor TFIID subunit 4b-like isoform X2 [Prunus dulcis]VVA33867.1 PREDICTED: mRNAion initiation factor [Prunus dulcis]